MSDPIRIEGMSVEAVSDIESKPKAFEPDQDTPFKILVLGDFSGRDNRGIHAPSEALSSKRIHMVDRDDLEDVMAKLNVELTIADIDPGQPNLSIRFRELDDFLPDELYHRMPLFKTVKNTIVKLRQEREKGAPGASVRDSGTSAAPEMSLLNKSSLLDDVLDQTESPNTESNVRPGSPDGMGSFLLDIVSPYLIPKSDPKADRILESTEALTSDLMRAILHYPDFCELEASWRALDYLVRHLETDQNLKIYILDISKSELASDLLETDRMESSALFQFMEKTVKTAGITPWSVIAGNYTFYPTKTDAALLARIAQIAQLCDAPFISSGHHTLLQCPTIQTLHQPDDWNYALPEQDSQAWEVLRKLPESSYIGLLLPGFLLRLPYGRDTEPIDAFDFEELSPDFTLDQFLWGNPCFAALYLLGKAFSANEWNFQPGEIQDLKGLPLFTYNQDGSTRILPCAQVLITQRAAERILDQGLMPLLSFKDQDVVKLARFQSISNPVSRLNGPWER